MAFGTGQRRTDTKRLLTALILLGIPAAVYACFTGTLNYSQKPVRYVCDVYGRAVASRTSVRLIQPLPGSSQHPDPRHASQKRYGSLAPVLFIEPGIKDFQGLLDRATYRTAGVLVECSALDAWHTTQPGFQALQKLRKHTLRIVVFDGGHHLPTLGIAPDLILVPVTRGFAAHGHTMDAMRVEVLLKTIRREGLSTPVVAVPRFGLVKTAKPMETIAVRAIRAAGIQPGSAVTYRTHCGRRAWRGCTILNRAAFCSLSDPSALRQERIAKLQADRVLRIYLSLNYARFTAADREALIQRLKQAGIEGIVVNEPVNVGRILIGRIPHA